METQEKAGQAEQGRWIIGRLLHVFMTMKKERSRAIQPSITVVVPSYNQGDTIEQTLVSVMDHNDNDGLETIVLDSLSTDSTGAVLDRWRGRIADIRERDTGQGDALDKGFRKARGDIVCWLNTDDMFFPGVLDHVRKLFRENPEVEVISGLGVHLDSDGGFLNIHPAGPDFDDCFAVKHKIVTVLQPTVFFRRSALERIGGIRPDLQYLMDWDLWLRFYESGANWMKVDRFFAAARVYGETKTARGGWERIREHWRLARQHTGHMVPLSTAQLFLFWALFEGNGFQRKLFSLLRWFKYTLSLRKTGKSAFYSLSSFSEFPGKGYVAIPWYRGGYSAVKLSIELSRAPSGSGRVNVTVRCGGAEKIFLTEERSNTFIIDTPGNGPLIGAEIRTEPETTFRVTQLRPN